MASPTLHTAVVAGLETAINKALTLDPSTQKKLARLQDHCFHIHCTTPNLNIYLIPGSDEVRLCGFYSNKANTTLKGSASAFSKLLTSTDPASTLINSELELHGDSNALINLQKIAQELDLDWEAPLVSLLGDVAGHQISKGIRHSVQFGQQFFTGLKRQIEDYIVEESDTMPARWETDKFFSHVDQLAMRTERLAAQLNKLSQQTE